MGAMGPVMQDVLSGADLGDIVARAQGIFMTPAFAAFGALFLIVGVALACVFYVAMFGVNARAVQAALDEGKIEKAA